MGFEPLILDAVQRWSLEGEHEQIEAHSSQADEAGLERRDALQRGAERADQWAREHIYEAGLLARTLGVPLLNSAAEGLQAWVRDELSGRLLPMYQGAVPAPPPALGGELSAPREE